MPICTLLRVRCDEETQLVKFNWLIEWLKFNLSEVNRI